ncbi:MAG: PilZ domain-containing protein [Clostridiaceae bacterium]|nr:PilZ domain-containing protein [Clostridiaceae bacterium]
MSVLMVDKDEFFNVLQSTNLIKVRFDTGATWNVFPVLYVDSGNLEIFKTVQEACNSCEVGKQVAFKFQKQGYEYIADGTVVSVSNNIPQTLTIKYIDAKKYINIRKHIRFDTNLESEIRYNDCNIKPGEKDADKWIACMVKNISKGGAMIEAGSEMDLNSEVEVRITLNSGKSFLSTAEVLRKSKTEDNKFIYGVKFLEVSQEGTEILNQEIKRLENEYFTCLNPLREYNKTTEAGIDTKVLIMSDDPDESYDLRESLIKLGVQNFDIMKNFMFYCEFFREEKLNLIIIDTQFLSEDVRKLIENINNTLPEINILLALPIESMEECNELIESNKVDILFKPLIYNEFEDKIIKYL